MLRILWTLNEAQARWYVALEATARGRGGLQAMAELTGMSRTTILRGMRELREGSPLERKERVHAPGGGRNEGFASVGMTRDTAEFAVEAIRRW